jgi:uncharacterized protein YgbK (DUF1537 family)
MISGLVADDLTGATDSAVQFSHAGWSATLLLDRVAAAARVDPDDDALLAVTADNRALPADAARDAAVAAVTELRQRGAGRLFVKVDSTMRGSAASHVAGALSAWSSGVPDAVAVVCPAYPRMGRRVEGGVVLVDGVPVAESAFRHDPITPVTSSVLGELLPGSVPLLRFGTATVAEALELAVDAARRGGGRTVTADAGSDADLQALADAIAQSSAAVIPVGSAGLAAAMARAWRPTGVSDPGPLPATLPATNSTRALVQVTSLNDVSRRQLAALERRYGDRCLRLTPDLPSLTDPAALDRWFATQSAGSEHYDLVVLSAPVERAADTDGRTGRLVADRLGDLTARLLRTGDFGVAGFVGGDGARAALAHLRVTALRILGSMEDGVPLSVLADGDAPGTVLFTKAGGFGDTESLISVVARLTPFQTRRTNA